MLENIDAFAFKILVIVYNLLGIQGVPSDQNSEWKIVEMWRELPDKTYLLELESDLISKVCNEVSLGYIIFPQNYMGQIEIEVAGQVVFTNSMTSKWNLYEMQSRPIINCRTIKYGSMVKLRITSYINFFSSINHYPKISRSFPLEQMFYIDIFFVATIAALLLGLASTILVTKYTSKSQGLIYLIFHLSFATLVMSHIPGKFFEIPLPLAHTLAVIGAACSTGSLALVTTRSKFTIGVVSIFALLSALVSFIFLGFKHATHFMVFLSIPIAMLTALFLVVLEFRKSMQTKNYYPLLLYIAIMFVVSFDAIRSQIVRDSFLHLSSITLMASVIAFYYIIERVNLQKIELVATNIKLENESNMIRKINSMYLSYKEVIHDLKSPVMSLSFFLSAAELKKDNILIISERLKRIINRIDDVHVNRITDWYALISLIKSINSLQEEKTQLHKGLEFRIELNVVGLINVFCDPIDFSIVVEEILENSVKYGNGKTVLSIDIIDAFVVFSFKSQIASSSEKSDFLPPSSFPGSGLGLQGIKKKIILMAGVFEYTQQASVFISIIKLKFK